MSVFRSQYRQLTDVECKHVGDIKQLADELHQRLGFDETRALSREFALAKTKLEECVMWAVKAITG